MEWCPPLHLGVLAIEKGAFGSPTTKVGNFTYYIKYDKQNISRVGYLIHITQLIVSCNKNIKEKPKNKLLVK